MGNSLTSEVALDNNFFSFSNNTEYVIYGALSLIFTAIIVYILSIVGIKIRRRFPLKVNCWFCNENSTVPYELSNCWDCPHCKQYNGFSKDGDYNKIIPEQFNPKLNEAVAKSLRTSIKSKENTIQSNGLCKICNINQQLKIQQLALFVPLNENNYYEEIEEYREKLEKAYQLCSKCEITLKQTLEKQEYNLLQNRLNSHKTNTSLGKLRKLSRFDGSNALATVTRNGISGLKLVSSSLAILLFLALLLDFETEYQLLNLSLPEVGVLEPLLPVFETLLILKENISCFKKELSFAGLLCSILMLFQSKTEKNYISLSAWGLLNLANWSPYTGLQLMLSGICFILSIKRTQNRFRFISKKSTVQPVTKVFPDIYDNKLREESEQTIKMSSPLIKRDSIASLDECDELFDNNKVKRSKQKSKNVLEREEKKKKGRQRENETEISANEEEKESSGLNSSQSSSLTQKSFMMSTEADKNYSESNGPFSEVFNTLSSLQLGTQKKSNKPPNFLFANHNFSESKSSSSIIKPAKFIKNFNSTSWTESNECNSRSSTPSSGYSSQKPVKMEPNRNDFPKTMTPLFMNNFGRQSPGNYFDYYDGNQGFYNNCFSPGFVPFQQYPGPMGHAAMFSSTRPTNFPVFFSPWQGYSPQKFSPASSRFSDSSDLDNLFQESSKRFEKNQKLSKFKTVLYYFSIFCNFITMVGLAFFISTGVILVDWKLPTFNFFM